MWTCSWQVSFDSPLKSGLWRSERHLDIYHQHGRIVCTSANFLDTVIFNLFCNLVLQNTLSNIWGYTVFFLFHKELPRLCTTKCLLIIILIPVVFSITFHRAWMEAHGSARLSRKRKREGSNGEAEEGEKPVKLKRCTVVSEIMV